MNHELINALIELYKNEPKDSPEMAAMRVAVLIERCLRTLESQGKAISNEAILKEIKRTIQHQKKVA